MKNKKTGRLDKNNPIYVNSIDFSEFKINNFNKDDFIILKLDIEGAEYKVLETMISDSAIDYINILLIEFHNYKVNIPVSVDNNILNICKQRNIKVITEDMIANGCDPKGNWFEILDINY